ncbi:MAG: hypothetical protein DRI61_09205 [Chloroflexi bacterium]|nr:MAG: hypothetical protein DRI61_09205 [Chloroflexota bacterium]
MANVEAMKAYIISSLDLLPPESLELLKEFVAFLRSRVAEEEEPVRKGTAEELAGSPLVGLWADREDIGDSVEFVRKLREQIERRHYG